MRVLRHAGPTAFLDRAGAWLTQREVEHNLVLGLAASLARSTVGYQRPLYFATAEHGGVVRGCAFRTPPYKLGLTRMPAKAVALMAADVAEVYEELPAVLGPVTEARLFASAWAARTGVSAAGGSLQRIYRLSRVSHPPTAAPGRMRLANTADLARIVPWLASFLSETNLREAGDPELLGRRLVWTKSLAVWVDAEPVSMAGFSGRTANGVRIGYVYTPGESRGRGYATALVAQLSQHILDLGYRHCCLYADVENPVPNHIYQAIGYQPVADVMDMEFTS